MALNDIGILGFIIFFFLASATFIPLIQADYTGSTTSIDTDGYTDDIISEASILSESPSLSPFSIIGVFTNVFKLAFIGLSGLPFWLDLFYTFLSIMMVLLMIKFIPQVGSGG